MAGVSVFITGTLTRAGVPLQGTITVTSTSQPAGASAAVSPTGSFELALNVAYGDTLTFSADWGHTATATQTVAFEPVAAQDVPVTWDTLTGVVTGVGRQP